MPTYQYACTECDAQLEVRQSFTDDALTTCPTCDGRLRKIFNAVGVVFKGSGFYRTDSRKAPDSDSGGSDGKGSDGKGSDGKGTDSKGTDSKGSDSKGSDSGSGGAAAGNGTAKEPSSTKKATSGASAA